MATRAIDDATALIRHRSLILDLQSYKLLSEGKAEPLSTSQAHLLAALMAQPGKVHSARSLSLAMKKDVVSEEALKVSVSRLRRCLRRLGLGNAYLRSVRGVGYIFDPEANLA